MLAMWRRIAPHTRQLLWKPYGTFVAVTATAMLLHIAFVSCNMVSLSKLYSAEDPSVEANETYAFRLRRFYSVASAAFAAQSVFESLQFLFANLAYLLLLSRLIGFAVGVAKLHHKEHVARRLNLWRVLLMTTVCIGSLVALCGSIGVAAAFGEISALQLSLAVALDSNSTMPEYDTSVPRLLDVSNAWRSVREISEVIVLPVMVSAFVASGLYCYRLQVTLQRSKNETDVQQIKKQVGVTVAVAFIALLMRAAYAAVQAYASSASAIKENCPDALSDVCNNPCRNLGYVISQWMLYTPAFRCAPPCHSSPLRRYSFSFSFSFASQLPHTAVTL